MVGALLLFTVSLFMVIQLSGAMGEELEEAALASEIAVLARQQMDSLETLPFDSLDVGTTSRSVDVQGRSYTRTITVSVYGPLLKEVSVSFNPPASGPRYEASSYVSGRW